MVLYLMQIKTGAYLYTPTQPVEEVQLPLGEYTISEKDGSFCPGKQPQNSAVGSKPPTFLAANEGNKFLSLKGQFKPCAPDL